MHTVIAVPLLMDNPPTYLVSPSRDCITSSLAGKSQSDLMWDFQCGGEKIRIIPTISSRYVPHPSFTMRRVVPSN